MQTLPAPGIHPAWARSWKAGLREQDAWYTDLLARKTELLEHYAEHGTRKPSDHVREATPDPVKPPWASWEVAGVLVDLRHYAALRHWEWERAAVQERQWRPGPLHAMLQAAELADRIALRSHDLFPQRHRGRSLRAMSALGFCYSALALAAGAGERALSLAALQLRAHGCGYYEPAGWQPTRAFCARMLADFLGVEVVVPMPAESGLRRDEASAVPWLEALHGAWRDPDPAPVAAACLAACDIHTHLCTSGRGKARREFGVPWSRTPVAVLLVLRLRRMLGLPEPELDHPLLDTAAGRLPAPATPHEDDLLLARVLARMRADGFDASAVRAG